ncbi:DUF3782 domain-containing protein [uncultured Thiocystis sp.]|uniref:DUF3782 domain-containing protein n=1 Tax=uncultured Thiocystis sp. TaxID=1202134 RepID=UPI0025EA0D4E|nr:DUF3782 domain-containing protein [uncultured Thiocystis sp.]
MATTTLDDVWALFREVADSQKQVAAAQKETDRKFQETDRKISEMNREVNKRIGELGGQWGLFVENLVAPACERLFTERGIPVHMVSRRVMKRMGGDTLEIDVLVVNAEHVVDVEVKSSLGVEEVREFLEDLKRFRQFFPEYADKRLHGAVAGMRIEEGAAAFAYRQGLFVLAPTGDSVRILNDAKFAPKIW